MRKAEQMHEEEVEPDLPRRLIKSQKMCQEKKKRRLGRPELSKMLCKIYMLL